MLMMILSIIALSEHLNASLVTIPEQTGTLQSNTSYLLITKFAIALSKDRDQVQLEYLLEKFATWSVCLNRAVWRCRKW